MTSPAGAFHVRTMTALDESFQLPIKRVGASPVAAAGSIFDGAVDSAGAVDSSGAADSDAAGVGFTPSSESLPEFEITTAASTTTATSTAKRTLPEPPERGAALGFAAELARGVAGAGVVETFTGAVGRDAVTRDAGALRAAALRVVAFFVVDFFAALFFTADFFTADFLAVDFFAADFFAGDFFTAFLAALFFFTATGYLLGFWKTRGLRCGGSLSHAFERSHHMRRDCAQRFSAMTYLILLTRAQLSA